MGIFTTAHSIKFGFRTRKQRIITFLAIGIAILLLRLIYVFIIKEHVIKFDSQCTAYPNNLLKTITAKEKTYQEIENDLKGINIKKGGTFIPENKQYFSDDEKLAIIVPYRDREYNLKIFIEYMHIFLSGQNLTYQIFLIEPEDTILFNRGLLLNIGYLEALKEMNFDCFVLHDVDMVPENPDNRYICNKQYPTQMAIAVSIYKYLEYAPKFFTEQYSGGVTCYTREQFKIMNGYSNSYYGWGGEDDDVNIRSINHFNEIARLSPERGRYFANCHEEDKTKNPNRFKLIKESLKRIDSDGLKTINYDVKKIIKNPLFTKVIVNY